MTRVRSLALWAGVMIPCGILAHLAAEAAALHRSVLELACTPLHAYLAIFAAASLATVLVVVGTRDVRRRAALLAGALPFRGRGSTFVAASAAIQLAFVIATIALEGDPLAAGSVLSALVASLFVALAAAFALQIVRARLAGNSQAAATIHRATPQTRMPLGVRTSGPYFAFVAIHGNRPPPFAFPSA